MVTLIVSALFILMLVNALGLVTMTVNNSLAIGGHSGVESLTITGESSMYSNPTADVAKAGTLTVRTSDAVGSMTLLTGHGISTGDIVDIYWSGGSCYGVTIGTVAGLVVPIASVTGGDILPAAATALTVGPRNSAVFNVVGSNARGILITSSNEGYVVFLAGSTIEHAVKLTGLSAYSWNDSSGGTNPITGDTITSIMVSQRGTALASTGMKITVVIA